jgi:hypothetical protein
MERAQYHLHHGARNWSEVYGDFLKISSRMAAGAADCLILDILPYAPACPIRANRNVRSFQV